jgi:hypothetical protein
MTLNYVRDWYQHFKTIKTQLKGQNSFIALEPYYEYQIDLFFKQINQSRILGWLVLTLLQNTQL